MSELIVFVSAGNCILVYVNHGNMKKKYLGLGQNFHTAHNIIYIFQSEIS